MSPQIQKIDSSVVTAGTAPIHLDAKTKPITVYSKITI